MSAKSGQMEFQYLFLLTTHAVRYPDYVFET